jgi:hypothetical protein
VRRSLLSTASLDAPRCVCLCRRAHAQLHDIGEFLRSIWKERATTRRRKEVARNLCKTENLQVGFWVGGGGLPARSCVGKQARRMGDSPIARPQTREKLMWQHKKHVKITAETCVSGHGRDHVLPFLSDRWRPTVIGFARRAVGNSECMRLLLTHQVRLRLKRVLLSPLWGRPH